ncbi:histidine kinase dimerization/phosphoacceptor domain -containing protein [Leptospira ognonensis]|nr:histidine kinase dimerization/phosphoacceptor domain -containing protein [Leptospira ognonensis]
MDTREKKSILLVEDEMLVALLTKKNLENQNYIVKHSLTGEGAISLISEKPYDLVLMDINLGPGIDGIKTAQLIQEKYNVPIVFLSSHTESEIIQKVEETSSYGYIEKGSDFNVINTSIKMALKLYSANQKMEKSERRYKHLIDISPIPYALNDDQDRILFLNKSFLSTFGYSLEEIPTLSDWWPKAYPDESYRHWVASQWAERLEAAKKSQTPFEPLELKIICKDGSEKKVVCSATMFDEEADNIHLVILYDLTELKTKEDSTRRITQLLESTQKISKIGGWEIDLISETVFWTKEMHQIHETNPEAYTPTSIGITEFLNSESKEKFQSALHSAKTAGTGFDIELDACTAKGKQIALRLTCEVTRNQGLPIKLTGTTQDISEQRLKEQTIRKLLLEKDILLKEIHHRIKNNMNTISSLIILQADLVQEQKTKEILFEASSRLNSMMVLYDKLYISKNQNSVSLKTYLPALLLEAKDIFPSHQTIHLEIEIEDIELSPKYLSPIGIIYNELLTNSLKYAFNLKPSGRIKVTAIKKKDTIILSYADDGQGYSMENSSGFGLQLISLLVEQIRGRLELIQTQEHPTLVTITFDL